MKTPHRKAKKSDDDEYSSHGFSDEDQDEEALLGDEWDAEEKPKETKAPVPVKPKILKKRAMEKRQAEAARKARERQEELENNPEAAFAEKMRLQKAVEEADLENTMDLFGGAKLDESVDPMASSATSTLAPINVQGSVEDYKLDTDEDWDKFAGDIVKAISTKKSSSIEKFLGKLIRDSTARLRLDACNNIKKVVQVICTTKQKEEKDKKKEEK